MNWKTAHRSFYYANAEEPEDIVLPCGETAHLVIDIQNTYMHKDDPEETNRWAPFFERMNQTVIPNTARLIAECRARNIENIFARIGCPEVRRSIHGSCDYAAAIRVERNTLDLGFMAA